MKLYVKFGDQFKNSTDVETWFAKNGLRIKLTPHGSGEALIEVIPGDRQK